MKFRVRVKVWVRVKVRVWVNNNLYVRGPPLMVRITDALVRGFFPVELLIFTRVFNADVDGVPGVLAVSILGGNVCPRVVVDVPNRGRITERRTFFL